MILEIKERCMVGYDGDIDENGNALGYVGCDEYMTDIDSDGSDTTGIRTIVYKTTADTLGAAIAEYENEFDFYNMISSDDDFLGEYLDTLSIISVRVLPE